MATLASWSSSLTGSPAVPCGLLLDRLTKSSFHLNFPECTNLKGVFVPPNARPFTPLILSCPIWQDSPDSMAHLSSTSCLGEAFPNGVMRLAGWAFCPSARSRWRAKEDEWIADAHAWFRISIQVSSLSPMSFQLCHAASSSPEGLGNISNCLQEICFTFLTDTAFQNQTPWKLNTEGVYMHVF